MRSFNIADSEIEKLVDCARRKCWADDPEFMVDDYAAGNIDDAYFGGNEDGYAQCARDTLELLDISWEN